MKQITIYLGDLVHNYISKGPFAFPLNIGYLASYTQKIFGDKVKIQLFKFPSELIESIKEAPPDILGLGNYTWNLDINNKIMKLCKTLSPHSLTVCGGPDYPVADKEAKTYLKKRKHVDFYILHQGEIGFANIVGSYLINKNIKKLKRKELANCVSYNAKSDKLIKGKKIDLEDLDDIPSPYLTKTLDQFFNENFIPIIETNRGCPYSCTYCAWGVAAHQKVRQFGSSTIKKEIDYIAKRAKNTNILMIADANFGIFERDVEISKYLRETKNKYGYPRNIFFAFVKGFPNRKLKICKILKGMTSLSAAFQSMNPEVLRLVKRTNEPNEFFLKQKFPKDMLSHTELILGLPGETKKSHEDAIRKVFDSNLGSMICYNLMMFGGSVINTRVERKKHGIKTKYRLLDNGFGKYNGITSFEIHEIGLATNTISEKDMLYFRPIHWLIQFMWNYKYFEEIMEFLKSEGINPLEYVIALIKNRKTAPLPIRRIFRDFYAAMRREWFETATSLRRYYSKDENFDKLKKGDFGKLNYQYSMRVLLECQPEFIEYAKGVALSLLESKETILNDIFKFIGSKYIDFNRDWKGTSADFNYDILGWKKEGCKNHLSEYKQPTSYLFSLSQGHKKGLEKVYNQFKSKDINLTLRKMIEYMKITDLFYDVAVSNETSQF